MKVPPFENLGIKERHLLLEALFEKNYVDALICKYCGVMTTVAKCGIMPPIVKRDIAIITCDSPVCISEYIEDVSEHVEPDLDAVRKAWRAEITDASLLKILELSDNLRDAAQDFKDSLPGIVSKKSPGKIFFFIKGTTRLVCRGCGSNHNDFYLIDFTGDCDDCGVCSSHLGFTNDPKEVEG